ncbi:MAG: hypothetical protein NZ551_07480 [Microscillaceae bacterium]|nr:hypothetical protein [Microscillaceae bacterium]MDW8461036.1 hypothetical protein [Cytophagales bacterium]
MPKFSICFSFFLSIFWGLFVNFNNLPAQNVPRTKVKNKEAERERKIRYIEDIYVYTRDKISQGKFYLDEYHVNTDSLVWQDGQTFQWVEYYYYSYLGNSPSLRLYSHKWQKDNQMYYIEFLFDIDLTPLFCYQKQNLENQYKYRELRAYFEQGQLISLIVDDIIVENFNEYSDKIRNILADMQDCIHKFQEQGAVLHKY